MNRKEIIQVLTLLSSNYESFAKRVEKDEQVEIIINTWQECLGDLEYNVVLGAVKKCIIESPYPPTIHDIRKNAMGFINPPCQKTAIEAWNEAYTAICNGSYMTQEEFKKLSPEVQSFFGNLRQVKELSLCNIDDVNTVTKGQFLKQYEIITKRKQDNKLLPEKMQSFIKQIASKTEIKKIEG